MVVAVDLSHWTPVRVNRDDDPPTVDWCHMQGIEFTEPFFSQTVDRALRHPFRLLFRQQTDMDELCRATDERPGLPPAGFIFHMSRCGSTLVAQVLAAVDAHLVLSEPSPLEAVLRPPHSDASVRWVRAMTGALGQSRNGRQRRMFVKFDAWSALDLPLVREAFPAVPWLFVFRDPVEVLVSHARRRGAHVIPGVLDGRRFGADGDLPPDVHAARVLVSICEAALAYGDDPLATFVDYEDLVAFALTHLPERWGLPLGAEDVDRMVAAAGLDAKNPCLPFIDDGAAKWAQATDAVLAAAELMAPAHARLREARVAV